MVIARGRRERERGICIYIYIYISACVCVYIYMHIHIMHCIWSDMVIYGYYTYIYRWFTSYLWIRATLQIWHVHVPKGLLPQLRRAGGRVLHLGPPWHIIRRKGRPRDTARRQWKLRTLEVELFIDLWSTIVNKWLITVHNVYWIYYWWIMVNNG